MIEHLVGAPLERVADDEVFRPLGMVSTSYLWRPGRDSSAQGYEFSRAFVAFSLHTSAGDYARLVAHAVQSETGPTLLTPQVAVDDRIAWRVGWGLAGDAF